MSYLFVFGSELEITVLFCTSELFHFLLGKFPICSLSCHVNNRYQNIPRHVTASVVILLVWNYLYDVTSPIINVVCLHLKKRLIRGQLALSVSCFLSILDNEDLKLASHSITKVTWIHISHISRWTRQSNRIKPGHKNSMCYWRVTEIKHLYTIKG